MRLYHYTTIDGMIGLLVNEDIWMTDCRFCNDRREIISFLSQALENWEGDPRWDALSHRFGYPRAHEKHLSDFVSSVNLFFLSGILIFALQLCFIHDTYTDCAGLLPF